MKRNPYFKFRVKYASEVKELPSRKGYKNETIFVF